MKKLLLVLLLPLATACDDTANAARGESYVQTQPGPLDVPWVPPRWEGGHHPSSLRVWDAPHPPPPPNAPAPIPNPLGSQPPLRNPLASDGI